MPATNSDSSATTTVQPANTTAVAVGTAVLAAVTLLPALMSLAGRHINSLALPARLHPSDDPAKEGMWGRWAGFVTRRPLIPVLMAIAMMVPLIIPVLSLELGQEDIGQTNPATMERRAYDLMSAGFGPGYNGPLIIAVALAPKAKGDPKVVDSGEPAEGAAEDPRSRSRRRATRRRPRSAPSRRSWSNSSSSSSRSSRC